MIPNTEIISFVAYFFFLYIKICKCVLTLRLNLFFHLEIIHLNNSRVYKNCPFQTTVIQLSHAIKRSIWLIMPWWRHRLQIKFYRSHFWITCKPFKIGWPCRFFVLLNLGDYFSATILEFVIYYPTYRSLFPWKVVLIFIVR